MAHSQYTISQAEQLRRKFTYFAQDVNTSNYISARSAAIHLTLMSERLGIKERLPLLEQVDYLKQEYSITDLCKES